MANLIKCPDCGESNPAGQEFCQYCRSPLSPLAGKPQSITPGQSPTPKSTSDLEPVLPQWLRDARDSARQSYQEEPSEPPKTPQPPPHSSFSSDDLLAGLQSQSQDEEDDIPDWLANITGEAPKPKKPDVESPEVRWVELGDPKDHAQPKTEPDVPTWLSTPPAEEKDELTDWLRAADAAQQPSQSFSFDTPSATPSPSDEKTSDWLHSMVTDDSGAGFGDSENAADETFASDTPDWLRGIDGESVAPVSSSSSAFSDTPDWLKAMDAETASKPGAEPVSSDTPDWLKAMDANAGFQPSAEPASSDAPDWLKAMDTNAAQPGAGPASSDAPDWLKAMDANAAKPSTQPVPSDVPDWLKAMDTGATQPGVGSASSDTPDWLKAMSAEPAASEPGIETTSSDTPDWLKRMGAESAVATSSGSDTPDWLRTLDEQGKGQGEPLAAFSGTDLGEADSTLSSAGQEPDWLKSLESPAAASDQDWLKGFQSVEEEKPSATEKPAPTVQPSIEEDAAELPSWLKAAAPQSSIFSEPPAAQEEPLPASSSSDMPDWLNTFQSADKPASVFASDEPTVPPVSTGDVQPVPDTDSLFTELPDWLSVVDEAAPPESIPSPITNADAIAPGELPSWVQAMRPVDAGISQAAAALTADRTLETRGALAGLQGVLPAAPGYAPTSKPKPYSIKLQASEEQLSHAALLEQILSAETSPVSIGSFAALGTSRALRWLLVVLFFVILPAVLFMRTTFFALPDSMYVPIEVGGALNAAQSIPQDAPVLAIFDYDPARAGEVESIAMPMFDQLILRRSRLTFVSTAETGAVLAERLISSGYLAGHNYQSGVQYLNLGYLPGGQMGIRAFAENPVEAAPYAFAQTSMLDFAPVSAWTMPPLAGVNSLPQFAALVLITDDADSARAWIEQTTSTRGSTPFVVISSAQAAPMLQPYFASGQISGLVSGLHGGALFEQYNNQKPGTARAYWDAYSIGMLLAMALILGGGLISLVLGLRDRATVREAN